MSENFLLVECWEHVSDCMDSSQVKPQEMSIADVVDVALKMVAGITRWAHQYSAEHGWTS